MPFLNFLRCGAAIALICYGPPTSAGATPKVLPSAASSAPKDQPLYRDWRLVAQADLIVRGELEVPIKTIRKSIRSKHYGYADLKLRVHTMLKGQSSRRILVVRFYTTPDFYRPSNRTLFNLQKKEVLAFISQSDEGKPTLYLAGYTPKALQSFNAATAVLVQKEVVNQNRIAAHFADSRVGQPDSYHGTVKKLILATLNPKTEEEAFKRLVGLGAPAVPSIIRLMDDRRKLAIPRIVLRNTAKDRFEEFAFYGPEVVVDALNAILPDSTGESFSSINNGGSERERQHAVESWRIYLHYRLLHDIATNPKKD